MHNDVFYKETYESQTWTFTCKRVIENLSSLASDLSLLQQYINALTFQVKAKNALKTNFKRKLLIS